MSHLVTQSGLLGDAEHLSYFVERLSNLADKPALIVVGGRREAAIGKVRPEEGRSSCGSDPTAPLLLPLPFIFQMIVQTSTPEEVEKSGQC